MFSRMHAAPDDLDRSTTRRSAQGLYQVRDTLHKGPITLNTLHSWTIRVTTPCGEPITDALSTVDGGMPQHGHGMQTRPLVIGHLGGGAYLIEGMKFQAGGWWVVDVTVDPGGKRDTVRFNVRCVPDEEVGASQGDGFEVGLAAVAHGSFLLRLLGRMAVQHQSARPGSPVLAHVTVRGADRACEPCGLAFL